MSSFDEEPVKGAGAGPGWNHGEEEEEEVTVFNDDSDDGDPFAEHDEDNAKLRGADAVRGFNEVF